MPPVKLYRFRPLDSLLFERELDALDNSYLYAPPFSSMNDPMEAFYELDDLEDSLFKSLFGHQHGMMEQMYKNIHAVFERCGLVSFSTSHMDLPMWAYYATNFSGMCLEFKTEFLTNISDFQNEPLVKVEYGIDTLPPLELSSLSNDSFKNEAIKRLSRKRIEWEHEKEWRLITGEIGRKYYTDDSLTAVYFGPRANKKYIETVCEKLKDRPVDIYQGIIKAYDLQFRKIQSAEYLIRIEKGECDLSVLEYEKEEIMDFLDCTEEELLKKISSVCQRPNIEKIFLGGLSVTYNAIYLPAVYKLRNGRKVSKNIYLDKKLNEVVDARK